MSETDEGFYLCEATNGIGAGLSAVIFLTINGQFLIYYIFILHLINENRSMQIDELRCLIFNSTKSDYASGKNYVIKYIIIYANLTMINIKGNESMKN